MRKRTKLFFSPVRWFIAKQINKLPNTCWAKLALWSETDCKQPFSWVLYRFRDVKQDWVCERDAKEIGSCYCGKVKP